MCSSTRGPAIVPSLVTCPTKMTTMPRCLASRVELRRAFARPARLLPGARSAPRCSSSGSIHDDDLRHLGVDRRHDPLRAAPRRASTPARGRAPASARAARPARPTPRAVTYSAYFAAPIAAIACSSSVDLPMPGRRRAGRRRRDQPSAQHPVELLLPVGKRSVLLRLDAREPAHRARGAGDRLESRRRGGGHRLDQRVPLATVRALALPLRTLAAALGAAVDGLRLGHARGRLRELGRRDDRGPELAHHHARGFVGDAHRVRQRAPAPISTPSVAMTLSPRRTRRTPRASAPGSAPRRRR